MKATKAVATIEPGTDDADSPNGTFHVVLSTPTKDRDGEEVKTEEWEQPLPDHITFDMDHGMSVASTVGSGRPSIEPDGQLHVRGTYSSRPLAQEVRGLVNEGHIKTTSVAFLRKSAKDEKSGAASVKRELLNGAFVAIPANKEAVVLSSKAAEVELDDAEIAPVDTKAGRRHSTEDAAHIQAIYDHAVSLGAAVGEDPEVDVASLRKRIEQMTDALKAFDLNVVFDKDTVRVVAKAKYSAEELRRMGANGQAFRNSDGSYSYPIGDSEDLSRAISAVGRGGADHDKIRAYIIRRARALGATDKIPDNWNSDGSLKGISDTTSTAAEEQTASEVQSTVQRVRARALASLGGI